MQHWISKFRNAFRGLAFGIYGQSSFVVHFILTLAVLAFAALLRCEAWQWCVLLLCIALVLSFELMNSAIEHLARGLCNEDNSDVGKALDIASAAVLSASIFAAIVGTLVFSVRIMQVYL